MVKWKYNFIGEVPPLPPLTDILKIKEQVKNEVSRRGINISIDEIDYTNYISQNTVLHIFDYTPKTPTPQAWTVIIPVIIAIANAVAAYYTYKVQEDTDFKEKTYNHVIETPELNNNSSDFKNNIMYITLALILIFIIIMRK